MEGWSLYGAAVPVRGTAAVGENTSCGMRGTYRCFFNANVCNSSVNGVNQILVTANQVFKHVDDVAETFFIEESRKGRVR